MSFFILCLHFSAEALTDRICVGIKPKVIDLTPKDKVAGTLTELRVNCRANEKVSFILLFFLFCQFINSYKTKLHVKRKTTQYFKVEIDVPLLPGVEDGCASHK